MDAEKQVINYPNGDIYIGCLDENGLPDGYGVMEYKDKHGCVLLGKELFLKEYRGDWKHGVHSGSGRMVFQKIYEVSVKYSGDWRDGKPDGLGKLTITDKGKRTCYDGEWKAGLRNGLGKYIKEDDFLPSEEYNGEWVDDKRCGNGERKYTYNRPYKNCKVETCSGVWENDRLNGHGVWTSTTGERIECEWVDGLKQGPGTYTLADGLSVSAVWENNSLLSSGISVLGAPDSMILFIRVGHSGLDYNRKAVVLLPAKVGKYTMDDVFIVEGTKDWRRKQMCITITDVEDSCVSFIVPSDFVRGSEPYKGKITRGERVELGFCIEGNARIYDEDYDYDITATFIMECN